MKAKFLNIVLLICYLDASSQGANTDSTEFFADNFKKLIALNSSTPDLINLSYREAVIITTRATAKQIVEITAPYINSTVTNAKTVCLDLLSEALFKKTGSQIQKQEIVEIICKNYLNSNYEIQIADNILLQLSEQDFTPTAKNYIAALWVSGPKASYDICAKLLAIAQIHESIPMLWKIANTSIETMTRSDVDILAALARMNESRAGILLCNYYNNRRNRTDYRYIFLSKNLAFSLDSIVLNCMINDFKTIDIEKSFHDGDSFFYPSGYLGANIIGMLNNYPYSKEESRTDTMKLLRWLNETTQLQLGRK